MLAIAARVYRGGRLLRALRRQRHRVDGVGVIAQLNVDRLCLGRRNGKRICDKALGYGNRVDEIRICADRVEQKEFLSAESTLPFRRGNAMNSLEFRDADQIHQRLPVAFNVVGSDRTELQRTECGRPEQFHRIKHGVYRLRILQREVAVLEAQEHAERLVGSGNLNLLGWRKRLRHLRLQEEVKPCILRQLVLIAEPHYGRRAWIIDLDALGQHGNSWARRRDFGFQIKGPAILERNVDRDGVIRMKFRRRTRVLRNQLEFVLLVGPSQRVGSEVKAIDLNLVDLIQARAFEQSIRVAGMNVETVEAPGFSVSMKRNLVDFAKSELLDP